MPLPSFDAIGDLPPGVYPVTLGEVLHRFGAVGGQREVCTRNLSHIYELAQRTGHLRRFVVFGSYVTAKPNPNDVDLVLVMDDEFRLEECPIEARGLFEHAVAQARFGASVFWICPRLLSNESVEDSIAYWQIKRDGTKRGIVEVVP